MAKSLSVFLRDLRAILRNPVAALVVAGLCVVPCLYAWINVLANWDPYENTSDVPVAIVNEDQPVTLHELGRVCVGDMMVRELETNDKIGWLFLDEDEALEGVRSGACYAAIVIPSDFTAHLTSILDGKTEKARLKYYVNEKVNPIAPKVTDTGASTLETTLDNEFVAKVGAVVAEKLGNVTDQLMSESHAALGTESVALDEVHATLVDVSDQLGSLSQGLDDTKVALQGAQDALAPLEGVGARVSNKLGDVLTRFEATRANANGLVADINEALGRGAAAASSLSATAHADVSAVAGDVALAQSQINAAIRALENDLTDNQALASKVTSARELVVSIQPVDGSLEPTRRSIQNELDREVDLMAQLTHAQQAKIDELRSIAQNLETAAQDVASKSQALNDTVRSAQGALQGAQTTTMTTTLSQINGALDQFVGVGTELEAASRMVDPVITQTVTLAGEFAEAIGESQNALSGTQTSLAELTDAVESLNAELSAISASQTWTLVQDLLESNPEGVEDFLAAPVEVNEIDLFPVENYASGVAPFFTSLALWVGGIALVAIFKLEVDEGGVGPLRPWQAYFGRWLLFVTLGAIQAVVCCAGDLAIGIQCAHPWAFFLSAVIASFVFVNIIYALSVAFKHLGKALAFTLVILQVPGSAGTYPIEMMPPFFQAMGPWLPFTYSNNAMREAIGGIYGSNLAHDLAMLLLFVVPSILLGVTMRGHLVNVNALFDRRLRETDHLMVMEPVAMEGSHHRVATLVKALQSPKEYHEELRERSAAFERVYPTLVRRGVLLLLLLPLLLFALMLGLDAKLPSMAALVVSIIMLYIFLILVEYFHDRINTKLELTELPEEELQEMLNNALREEFMPYTRIDAILERRR